MNEQPQESYLDGPVHELISDQAFALTIQEMLRNAGYEGDRARQIAVIRKCMEDMRTPRHSSQQKAAELDPGQEMMSYEEFALIAQEMVSSPGYEAGRARRIAAIKKFVEATRDWDRSGLPADGLDFMRDHEDDQKDEK